MKNTGAHPNITRRPQPRDPRQPPESTSAPKEPTSSQRATERAKRGEPLTAEDKRDRSPKQENL